MSERNFFVELKRRNVYRVAVAYAVVAWLAHCNSRRFFFRRLRSAGLGDEDCLSRWSLSAFRSR